MNIIWIAPPAAGKGTYSSLLKEKYGFTHISAGDVLREQVSLKTEIGKKIEAIINKGEMVDDNLMKELIENKINSIDLSKPFMLDGYPRKLNQAHDYEQILESHNIDVDKVLFINISKETGLKRVLGRLNCPNCKRSYNEFLKDTMPKKEGICDECNIPLERRKDDRPLSYENRYHVYMTETSPVIEYFRNKGKLIEIDGSKSPEETLKVIENILGVKNG